MSSTLMINILKQFWFFQAKMFMKYSSKPLKLETVRNDIIKGTLDVISSLPVYLKGESDRKKKFNFKQTIQILQPRVIDYFWTHSYTVNIS